MALDARRRSIGARGRSPHCCSDQLAARGVTASGFDVDQVKAVRVKLPRLRQAAGGVPALSVTVIGRKARWVWARRRSCAGRGARAQGRTSKGCGRQPGP
jgi:hypothetical protein